MTDQQQRRWDRWMPVILTVLPMFVGAFLAFQRLETRIAVLESRILLHEQSSTEVSAAVERRLATIESDIKALLQRPVK